MAAYQPTTQPEPDWPPEFEYLDPHPDPYEIAPQPDAAYDPEFERHMLKLGVTLEFGPEDLEANRDGDLSPGQIEQLQAKMRRDNWIALGILSLVAFILGIIGINAGPFLLVGAVAIMLFTLWAASMISSELDSLPDREVKPTFIKFGRLSLMFRRWGSSDETAKFKVERDKHITAPGYLYKVLRPNQEYCAYYVRVYRQLHLYRLLSIEPVGGWADEVPEPKPKRKHKRKWGNS